MAVGEDFMNFIEEALAPVGEIRTRRMFGGAGVYADDIFFAIIADDQLYLKADDESRTLFETAGLEQFSYAKKDGTREYMRYYAAPEEIYEDEDALRKWAGQALGAALRARKGRAKKKS